MGYRIIEPHEQTWETRPHADGEPAGHVAELGEIAGMEHFERTSDATSRARQAGDTDTTWQRAV